MKLIVDVQGFKTSDKTFTPKELAAYDGAAMSHYIFKSPFTFVSLPPHLQHQARWLMTHHHCILWDEGFTPAFLFPAVFRNLLRGVTEIYVKGREKAEFLRRYTNIPIVEVEEQPALSPTRPSCLHHSSPVCYCALSNVYHIYNHYIME